jgi:hypothetical protein
MKSTQTLKTPGFRQASIIALLLLGLLAIHPSRSSI